MVSVDTAGGSTTGISADDQTTSPPDCSHRCTTQHFSRPGQVLTPFSPMRQHRYRMPQCYIV
ncbi:hypothetical protein KYT97_23910 [Rhodococcus globerulus]|nr:hypothetical protein KYT97_23910 [Rhodococcus globerulus]